jgi:hypothetical protein
MAALAASRSSRATAAAASRATRLGLRVRCGDVSTKPRNDASSSRSSEYFPTIMITRACQPRNTFPTIDDEHVPGKPNPPPLFFLVKVHKLFVLANKPNCFDTTNKAYKSVIDDAKLPSDKDFESDEALRAFYVLEFGPCGPFSKF